VVAQARNVDIARAINNSVSVIRADVSGSADRLDSDVSVLQSAPLLSETLLIADIETEPRESESPTPAAARASARPA
jgi:hypothetical protein